MRRTKLTGAFSWVFLLADLVVVATVLLSCTVQGQHVTVTKGDDGGIATQVSVMPAQAAPGATTAISLSIKDVQTVTALVDLEVYSPSGDKAFQRSIDNQAFQAGVTRNYAVEWQVPPSASSGEYQVKIGVFSPGWGTLYHWNNGAASITVTGPSSAAAAADVASPGPVAVSATATFPGGSAPPPGLPNTLQLGMSDSPGGAAAMKQTAPFGFRYQYLAGGVNTGKGWASWNGNGDFATYYIDDSVQNGIIPVFSYYMLLQSSPGSPGGDAKADLANLQNNATMVAYYNDLKLFFQKAAAFPQSSVVLHVEPDLWGYLEQQAKGDNAATIPAKVGSSGVAELAGLPDTVAGFAQAIRILRNTYAPNVLLGYHLSGWGTGDDILHSKPANSTVVSEAQQAAHFYQSLGTTFDLVFVDASDRDAAFKQAQYGDKHAWWSSEDYRRNELFLSQFQRTVPLPLIIWQIPLGNTKMRAENNTWEHYQDNHVETLIGDPSRAALQAYARAGVVALLFGRGADGPSCACDAANDGMTNPAPINGNTGMSLSADDDGGYFRQQAAAYYQAGALPLP